MVGIDISTCLCECPFMSDRLNTTLYTYFVYLLKFFYEILSCVEYPILSTENSGKLVKLFEKKSCIGTELNSANCLSSCKCLL